MNTPKLIVLLATGSLLAVLLLLTAGADDPHRYLAICRAGLMVLGLGGCAWGLLWRRMQIVLVSLLLLAVGFLSFWCRAS